MATYNLYSKRQKKLRSEFSDVYQYEDIPHEFRVQVIFIIKHTIGIKLSIGYKQSSQAGICYKKIHEVLCKEYGKHSLVQHKIGNHDDESIFSFFEKTENYEECLDIIELIFGVISKHIPKQGHNYLYQKENSSFQDPDDAINELNERFREWGIGYEFQNGELIRIDSQFIHSEAVKPILVLLANEKFYAGINQEFLKAHEHYRHKRYKECLVECCKAFESLMKAICEKRKWDYKPTDTASKLITTCFDNKLIPSYMDNQIASLKQILGSGVSTIRNKEGGHGQGAEISEVSEYLASYCLHLTASNLLFLANCEKQLG